MPVHNNLRIILYDSSGRGGVAQYTYQLAESLACNGSDVTVITTGDYELKHLKRSFKVCIPFTQSWMKSFFNMALSPLRRKNTGRVDNANLYNTHNALDYRTNKTNILLKNSRAWLLRVKILLFLLWHNPHIIHFQWLKDSKNDVYLMKFLKILRFPIVYTAHDLLPHDSNFHDYQNVFRKIYSISDKIIVHSVRNKREIIDLFKIDPKKVYVIPHGSFDLFYTEKNITKDTAREKIGIPKGKKIILFFGFIKKYKGLEYLVSAFQNIKEHLDDIGLLIVGKIHSTDSAGFKFYADLIEHVSHNDDIMCINEYIPLETINLYFLASDLVVLPYIKTYTSGVLLAAYAAGRPVIVTDTGALSEVVDIGKSGFLVPPKDINALEQAMMKALRDPDRLEEMGNYARYLSETVYSWHSIALKTTDVYRS